MEKEKSSQPKVLVFATSHRFQGTRFDRPVDEPCYRELIENLIRAYRINCVFEEAAGRTPTYAEEIAKGIADECKRPIDYVDVDPSASDREALGLSKQTGTVFFVDPFAKPPCTANEDFVADHSAREQFWLGRVREKTFQCALAIVGFAHGLSFSFRLTDAGYAVRCFNYYSDEKLCGRQHVTP